MALAPALTPAAGQGEGPQASGSRLFSSPAALGSLARDLSLARDVTLGQLEGNGGRAGVPLQQSLAVVGKERAGSPGSFRSGGISRALEDHPG